MPADVQNDPVSREAALLLMRVYMQSKQKSWTAIGHRYGLTKQRCHRIAHGTLKVNRKTDRKLIRAVKSNKDVVRRPKTVLRLIRRVALPFLAKRQRSSIGIYGAGGRPITEKG